MKRFIFLTFLIGFLIIGNEVQAASIGDSRSFNVDPSYDIIAREQITGVIKEISRRAYFYCDDNWWNTLDSSQQGKVKQALDLLGKEFDDKIYPTLTKTFGSEWKPGIDNDSRITILIHPMKEGSGGYFRSGDEYLKLENPRSNEREMVYLSASYITTPLAKSFLAHELVHLITFNQKEKLQGISEEVWLNEARAEYVSTLLGYDADYETGNLKRRVEIFLKDPSDSITEWQGKKADYGALNLFIQYLVDQYGVEILIDSIRYPKPGIESINYALKRNGFEQDFSQIFTDWTIAVLVNDCSLGSKYCYKNKDLKSLQVVPSLNFLPIEGKSTLGVSQFTKNWAGNWFKFIGGNGTLKIEFIGNPDNLFQVPYLVKDFSGNYSLKFIQLNEYQRGEISIPRFGSDINSVIIIPTIQSKTSNFLNPEPAFSYFWSVSITDEEEKDFSEYLDKPVSKMSRQEILAKIAEIERLLSRLKAQLSGLVEPEPIETSCQKFNDNLSFGLRSDSRVKCLQEFLRSQGSEIYPEGLVTGNFLSLTKTAVIRFQERYAQDILFPWNLISGTGYVGSTTRAKINELLTK